MSPHAAGRLEARLTDTGSSDKIPSSPCCDPPTTTGAERGTLAPPLSDSVWELSMVD